MFWALFVLYGLMPGRVGLRIAEGWRLVAHSLSGRLLLLTLIYILISETLIFVPSIGRYHASLLENRIESAEIAILPFTELGGEQLSPALRSELLQRAGAAAVMLKRADQRELFLVSDMPAHLDVTIDLRKSNLWTDMAHALDCIFHGGTRILHVIASTHITGAQTVEVIVGEAPIRENLLNFAGRMALLALAISLVSAFLVFLSLYIVLVRPMRRITYGMVNFRNNPEDPGRIISASTRRDEIGIAERELAAMQRDLYGSLQQKTRLAALGTAVAKIQHDLRNILSSAQLASDRLSASQDPVVQKLAPRLVAAIDRAVSLATNTLRYGRADESPPARKRIKLAPIVEEAGLAAISMTGLDETIAFENAVPPELEIDADSEFLFRIMLNLVRNAAQALRACKGVRISAIRINASRHLGRVTIDVDDNGPGIPQSVAEKLFQPFAGSTSTDGSGLGLAIARDLARAHGGDIVLERSSETGTCFRIIIPDRGTQYREPR